MDPVSLTSAIALRKFVRESFVHHNNQPFIHTTTIMRPLCASHTCSLSTVARATMDMFILVISLTKRWSHMRSDSCHLAQCHFAMLVRAHSHSACLSNVQPPCTVLLSPGSSNVSLSTTWTIALRPPVSRSAIPTSLRSAYPYRNMREKFSSIICSAIL